MKKIATLCILFFLNVCPLVFCQGDNDAKVLRETLIFKDLNLKVTIPQGWFSISNSNPSFIASVASAKRPRYEDTRYGFCFEVLKKGDLKDLMNRTAKDKATMTQQKALIKLGQPEEVEVAGLKGKEDLYLFTVRDKAYMYAVVGFEKDGIDFIIEYWTPRNGESRNQFNQFRSWIKDGISFLDPEMNINGLFKSRLENEDGDERAMIKKLEEKPDPRGYMVLGRFYSNKHDFKRAESAYKKAIEVDPNFADSYEAAGIFYREQRRYRESITLLEKAVKLQPKNSDFLNNLAGTYLVAGKRKKAIQLYQDAIALNPKEEMLKLRLAQAYWGMGNKTEAENIVNKLLAENPQNQTALLLLKAITGKSVVGSPAYTPSGMNTISKFSDASYGDQKQFLEKNLPENDDVLKLAKQAMLAEHAGNFKEAKELYAKLLAQKSAVIAAQSENDWALLHCAVQRTSELTGDETLEKEMLAWIKANMLDPQGPYHSTLSYLMPNVIDHLEKRIKIFRTVP